MPLSKLSVMTLASEIMLVSESNFPLPNKTTPTGGARAQRSQPRRVISIALAATGAPLPIVVLLAVGMLVSGTATALAFRGQGELSVLCVVYGVTVLATIYLFGMVKELIYAPVAVEIFYVLAVYSAFLTKPRSNLVYGAIVVLVLGSSTVFRALTIPGEPAVISLGITDTVHFVLLWAAATHVSRHLRESQAALSVRLRDIDEVVVSAFIEAGQSYSIKGTLLSPFGSCIAVGSRSLVCDIE